ncbi:MAG: T9SS type A sorting domain-containing protein [Candidatus Marinimicrobia bacterium]|nr:T9SS type A sorting domain-containing protein [Candidatus Neomarinimicrobiota bacterium]
MKLIRSSVLLFFVVLFVTNILFAQAFNEPESVVYDAPNDRYLVSNKGSGDIIIVPRTNPTNRTYFYTNNYCVSLRGMTIVDDILWAAGTNSQTTQNQYLFSFDLNPDNYLQNINIASGIFLNDVVADGSGNIYVSDANNNKIYKVNTTTGGYSDLNFSGSNGLLFDETNNRLLYTDDTPTNGSQISAIDLATNTSSVLITNPNFQFLDGLTVDHLGNYYVSSWSTNEVYRYDPNFASSVVASTGHNSVNHNGPADIFYDQVNNILAVPNFTANTVDFIPFSQLSTNYDETSIPSKFQLHQNFPNPFNPNTTIFYDVSRESNVKVTIFDLLGREIIKLVDQIEPIGNRSINWDGRDYTGNLVNAGVYIYQIEAEGFLQTKKMVLLK